MDYHRQFTIIILTYFLLTSCLCSQPARSRRQKRGIMKMMMHIMWDPVRLIRYWYAYDVTKEIAKSWRKIIPTILLLPLTQHMPQSHGLAKYVHPTVGVRDTNKKVKHSNIPVGSYYQGSAGNLKPVAIPPAVLHQVLPSRYTYEPPHPSIQYYSSRETDNAPKHKQKNMPHVIVSQIPYEDNEDDSSQYSVAHYFVADGSLQEEAPNSNVLFPEHIDYTDDIGSSSNYHVASKEREKNKNFHSVLKENHVHFVPHDKPQGTFHDENGQKVSPVFHAGQEIHIVLHPIPVTDFNSHSSKGTPDGQAVHFVPTHVQSNESYGMNLGAHPVLFKSVQQNSAESVHEEHTTETASSPDRNDWLNLNNSSVVFLVKEKTNASNAKSPVTWVSQSFENKSKTTEERESDLKPDETIRRTFSVHRNSPQKFNKDNSTSFTINRQNINMERLREDLKHGTPVLIPFNRNTYSVEVPDADGKNSVMFPGSELENHRIHDPSVKEERSKEVFSVPIVSENGINSSGEQSAERNSTQKLLLFLKRRKHP